MCLDTQLYPLYAERKSIFSLHPLETQQTQIDQGNNAAVFDHKFRSSGCLCDNSSWHDAFRRHCRGKSPRVRLGFRCKGNVNVRIIFRIKNSRGQRFGNLNGGCRMRIRLQYACLAFTLACKLSSLCTHADHSFLSFLPV
jgi:hypothetical protein